MMERIFLGVLCLSGWVIFSSCLLHQYHFVSERMNWAKAQTYCREKYTDLATIENTEEMNQLINTVSSAGHSSEVWIGMYIKIDWRWSDGYTGSGAEYRNWEEGYPYFYYNYDYFCVMMSRTNPWQNYDCNSGYPFVCNNGTQQDPKFIFVSQSMSWSSAQRYCRENFRDLATVTNDTQNQEIQKLVPSGSWPWIGLFRDAHINWSDGSGSSFTYWYGSYISIGSMSVMCAVSDLQNSGKWTIGSCERKLPFVCYSIPPPPVHRQILKVKIRRDSSVNLNDPAVQADLLKKFEDGLKENGVSGVTLKWRKQPDGKVFHKEEETSQKKNRRKTEL